MKRLSKLLGLALVAALFSSATLARVGADLHGLSSASFGTVGPTVPVMTDDTPDRSRSRKPPQHRGSHFEYSREYSQARGQTFEVAA